MKTTNKQQSHPTFNQELSEISGKIFSEAKDGTILIGGHQIDNTIRSVLKDEAKYIIDSRLWEILNATITNEASRMALNDSQNWEHVLSAKQLQYWGGIMKKLLHTLNK